MKFPNHSCECELSCVPRSELRAANYVVTIVTLLSRRSSLRVVTHRENHGLMVHDDFNDFISVFFLQIFLIPQKIVQDLPLTKSLLHHLFEKPLARGGAPRSGRALATSGCSTGSTDGRPTPHGSTRYGKRRGTNGNWRIPDGFGCMDTSCFLGATFICD